MLNLWAVAPVGRTRFERVATNSVVTHREEVASTWLLTKKKLLPPAGLLSYIAVAPWRQGVKRERGKRKTTTSSQAAKYERHQREERNSEEESK